MLLEFPIPKNKFDGFCIFLLKLHVMALKKFHFNLYFDQKAFLE